MFRSIDFRKHILGVLAIFGLLVWISNAGNNSANVAPKYHVKDVSAADAKALIDGGALVVDVRGKDQFAAGHIPGAISAPLSELEKGIPSALEGAQVKSIVVNCADGVTTGPEGTAILNKAGYANAVNLKPGFDGWKSAGYPVARK